MTHAGYKTKETPLRSMIGWFRHAVIADDGKYLQISPASMNGIQMNCEVAND